MKTLHLPIFTILMALLVTALSFLPQDAHAMSITVHTDKPLYNYGDTYTISGKVNPVIPNQIVSIVIRSPNYPHPSSLSVTPNSDGSYSYALSLAIKDVSSGNFTVIAQYGISKNQTTFSYNGPPCVQQNDYWYDGVHSAPASNPRVVDSLGNAITGPVKSGQQIQVTSDLTNGKNCAQTFAFIVQIQDLNGVTFSLSWITGTLLAGQSLNPAQSWTPTTAGVYTVQIFTWQSLDNPNALAPLLTTTINVEDDANLTQSSHTASEISPKLVSGPTTIILDSPLKQFQSGVATNNIKCEQDLQLVIKAENGYPTCIAPEHVTRLIQNGWTLSNPFNRIADTDILSAKTYNLKQVHYYDSSNLNPKVSLYDYSYDGIDKDDGLVSVNNQTFYQTTLDNDIYKLKGTSVPFHNVTFSFPEGTLATPGGAFVNLDVKFKDGFEEIYGGTTSNPDGSGSVGGISIPTQYGPHLVTTSITVLGNHTMPQAGLTIYKDKIKLLVSYDNHSSLQTIRTVSLGECDVPYESRTGFVPILYMPLGSTGKVCVDYSNGNEPTMVTPSVFDAQNLSQNTNDILVSPLQANIVHGNSTVVYTITSGNKAGFYGLTIFCSGTPIAVGYDNQSRIVTGDFPWLNHTYYCMLRSYDYHITGVGGGMGIKYVPP